MFKRVLMLVIAIGVLLSACSPTATSSRPAVDPTARVQAMLGKPAVWACESKKADDGQIKIYNGTWGQDKGWIRWQVENACGGLTTANWPASWHSLQDQAKIDAAAAQTFAAPIIAPGTVFGINDPAMYVLGTDKQPHKADWLTDCVNHPLESDQDSPSWGSHIVYCKETPGGKENYVLDAAMVATLASPWPGDEEVVGFIWAVDKGVRVIKFVIVASSVAIAASQAYQAITLTGHSDPKHDPNTKGTPAYRNALAVLSVWLAGNSAQAANGGPKNDNNFKCAVLRAGGKIVKGIIWMADTVNYPEEGGFLLWFKNGASKNMGGSYGQSFEDFLNGPEVGPTQSYEPMSCDDDNFPRLPWQFAK